MKLRCITHLVSLAAGLAVLPFGLAAATATSSAAGPDFSVAPSQPPDYRLVVWVEAKRRKLRRAYWILEQADHDYAGHRGKAMEEIRRAGKIIGMDLKGDGYGGEKQHWSNELLREARHNLLDVVEDTGGAEHRHIRLAIKEIDRALEVR